MNNSRNQLTSYTTETEDVKKFTAYTWKLRPAVSLQNHFSVQSVAQFDKLPQFDNLPDQFALDSSCTGELAHKHSSYAA